MFDNIIEDIQVYSYYTKHNNLAVLFMYPTLWPIIIYRLGYNINKSKNSPFREILLIPYIIIRRIVDLLTKIEISHNAEIGPGLYIPHYCAIIGDNVKIGRFCCVQSGVTITGGIKEKSGGPKIGNRVFVGTGAKIIGDMVIGDNVVVGANSVVTKSMPDNARVAGIPGKVINLKGSKDYLFYEY